MATPRQVRVDYTPNAKQSLFHACGADEVVYGGAKGGGKTCALVMEALAYGLEHPGADMYIFRETYDDLEANVIREWRDKVPQEIYTYNASKYIATLKNGTTLSFRHISNYDDAYSYNGRSIDWIGIDELTFHEERSVQVLLSCLRSAKGFKPYFRGTCNPGGQGHNWVRERYVNATGYGERQYIDPETDSTIAFVPAKVYDNTVLMANDPNYVKRLERLPDAQKKAFLYGDWDIFEGQYFSEFRRGIHVIKPFPIPAEWQRYRAIDYGFDTFAVLWIAVDTLGKVYVYRELAVKDLIISAAVQQLLSLSAEPVICTYSPPDLWARSQESGRSKADLFCSAGLTDMVKSSNAREAGWLAVAEGLKLDADGDPQIHIFDTCPTLISHLPQLQRDKRKFMDCAIHPHDITHIPDCLRYFMVQWISPTVIKEDKTDLQKWRDRQLRQRTKAKSYW